MSQLLHEKVFSLETLESARHISLRLIKNLRDYYCECTVLISSQISKIYVCYYCNQIIKYYCALHFIEPFL